MLGIAIVGFFVLALLGAPICVALGGAAALAVMTSSQPFIMIAQKMITGINSYTLISVPLFLLAGRLMNDGGITDRLFAFARTAVGRMRGGLGHVNVLSSMIFAGMSGSAVADAGGLGQVEMKAMHDQGYPDDFSAAVTCASSAIGPIIPPSIPMLIYAAVAETSPGQLFMGGVTPGILMGIALMVMIFFISMKRDYPKDDKIPFRRMLVIWRKAILPLMTIVIILGGISAGIFTATEAASVTVLYTGILSLFVYRTVKFRELPKIILETAVSTAAVMFIVSASNSFSWVLILNKAAAVLVSTIYNISTNKYVILFMINVLVLILGCFLDNNVVLMLVAPLLLPIIDSLGISRVHFGVFLVLNLMIGVVTPPVGMSLYAVSRISGRTVEQISKELWLMLIPLFIVLMLTTYIPQISMWLPNILFNK